MKTKLTMFQILNKKFWILLEKLDNHIKKIINNKYDGQYSLKTNKNNKWVKNNGWSFGQTKRPH